MKLNGALEYDIIKSGAYADLLYKGFKKVHDTMGIDPNLCIDLVFKEVGCTFEDLTEEDRESLIKRVEDLYNNEPV